MRRALLFLVLIVVVVHATCMAIVHPPTTTNPTNKPSNMESKPLIISRKDGGVSKTFSFDDTAATVTATAAAAAMDDNKLEKAKAQMTTPAGSSSSSLSSLSISQIRSVLQSTFLPLGYPTRTPRGYIQYAMWSWIQDLSTQLRGVLATQRVLEGVGVGREGATALSASLNFIVRDGCGMAATLLFTAMASSSFRCDVKRWRLFADLIVDVGITLEVAATIVPQPLFLPMICVGNMCKAMCGVAAGACGGAINLFWAKGSDISDINAKFGAQHTVTGALGLLFAAIFARSVSSVSPFLLWTLYSTLTMLHIYANTRCMKLVELDSFNIARMELLMIHFLTQIIESNNNNNKEEKLPKMLKLNSPGIISKMEPLFFFLGGQRRKKLLQTLPIQFGLSFNDMARQSCLNEDELLKFLQQKKQSKYIILPGKNKNNNNISKKNKQQSWDCILVALFKGCSPKDQIQAYFHAILLGRQIGNNKSSNLMNDMDNNNDWWQTFEMSATDAGWDLTTRSDLPTEGYEIEML